MVLLPHIAPACLPHLSSSLLDSALSLTGSLAHVSHSHLGCPDTALGPGPWVVSCLTACSWSPRVTWFRFKSAGWPGKWRLVETHLHWIRKFCAAWRNNALSARPVGWSVKHQKKFGVVSDFQSTVFPWSNPSSQQTPEKVRIIFWIESKRTSSSEPWNPHIFVVWYTDLPYVLRNKLAERWSKRKEMIKIRSELKDILAKGTIQRINKSWSRFFQNIKKLINPLSRLIKKKRERNQINTIRNERGDYNWYHRNTKDCKKLLRTNICQEIWNPGQNGQISRNIILQNWVKKKQKAWTDI